MKHVILTSVLALSLAACSHYGASDTAASAQSIDVAATNAALASAPGRSDAEKARDAGRKPAEVLAFLGMKPGDTVLDILASGGWYTEALSVATGPNGKVYAQNTAFLLKMRDGANDKALTARLAGGRLANVVRLDEELQALSVAPGSVDLAITGLNFHDVYNSFGMEASVGFLKVAHTALKPGGVFGIIDHVGTSGGDNAGNKTNHRMDVALAVAAAEKAGFVVEGQGKMLANAADDHTQNVFGPLRGKTDRFVLKLRKPAE